MLLLWLLVLVAWALPDGERGAAQVEPGPMTPDERWAVVVGINDYRFPGYPALTGAVHDAKAIAEVLEESGNFARGHVILLTSEATERQDQPTPGNLEAVLKNIAGTRPRSVVFYFSGHGYEVPPASGASQASKGQAASVLVLQPFRDRAAPVAPSYDLNAPPTMDLRHILDLLDATGASQRILFIDACRTMGTRGQSGGAAIRPDVFKREGTWALLCARAGQSCHEENGQGVFTRALLEALKGAANRDGETEGWLTSAEILTYIDNHIDPVWGQEPTVGGQAPVLPVLVLPRQPCDEALGFPGAMEVAWAATQPNRVQALSAATRCAAAALDRPDGKLRTRDVRDLYALMAAASALEGDKSSVGRLLLAARSLDPRWELPPELDGLPDNLSTALYVAWRQAEGHLVEPVPPSAPAGWPEGVYVRYNGGAGLFPQESLLPNVAEVMHPGRVVYSAELRWLTGPMEAPRELTCAERSLPRRRALALGDAALSVATLGLVVPAVQRGIEVARFPVVVEYDVNAMCDGETYDELEASGGYCDDRAARNRLGAAAGLSAALLTTSVTLTTLQCK